MMIAVSLLLSFCFGIPSPDEAPVSVFRVTGRGDAEARLRVESGALDLLAASNTARVRIPRADGPDSHATLQREELSIEPGAIHIDGHSVRLPGTIQLWSGQLSGETDSSVFLALSAHGTWGWIREKELTEHFITQPDEHGEWTQIRLVTDARLRADRSPVEPVCGSEVTGAAAPARAGSGGLRASSHRPVLRSRLALETDWQYYQIFNDPFAAVDYALALIGAANSRYRTQIDVVHTVEYVGFYTTPNDPWSSQDQGGTCYDVIAEFQAKWGNGGAPVDADLYHLFTGADTGCAIAASRLCDTGGAFSLTGRMDGLADFPPQPGPLNWDFVWLCHETGHNYGSPHTHQYCPPIDECAPSGYWGTCQDEQACITQATFMSYCHACPGGLSNYTTWFHPIVADVMRAQAEIGCLTPFEGVLSTDLGFASSGSQGDSRLLVTWIDASDSLRVAVQQAPSRAGGLFITSPFKVYQPFLGGTLVPDWTILSPVATDAIGSSSVQVPVHGSFPHGVRLTTQAWFLDPLGTFAASNAVEWELIKP
ncbi:MAG: M12 family metallo-peptidase [Planctomycetota bacterium]